MKKLAELRTKTTAELIQDREDWKWLWDTMLNADHKGWKTEWNKKIKNYSIQIKKINKIIQERA